MHPALAHRFPELQHTTPWLSLGKWPTAVTAMPDLGRRLGADLWVKRDDLSGEVMGGNKVRKLEPLLAQALQRGSRQVLTVGGTGSNHVVATALFGKAQGMRTRAVLFPQPMSEGVKLSGKLVRALGVDERPCPNRLMAPAYLAAALAEDPGGTYLLGPGGSSPLGTLGFVAGALELAGQIAAGQLPCPDEIFVALGSGGTAAGLLLGLAVARLPARVVAVRVVERPLAGAAQVILLARRTAGLLGWRGRLGRLEVIHDQIGPGYGSPTAAGRQALDLARNAEGLELETTYTAKAMAALLARRRSGRKLFWNTHNSRDLTALL